MTEPSHGGGRHVREQERAPPVIEVRGIGKRYGSVIALSDITTTVPEGAVTCVLGDNGAGKSTFIKILAGAHAHSEGELAHRREPTTFGSPAKPSAPASRRSTRTWPSSP